jgi:hypothetical protein
MLKSLKLIWLAASFALIFLVIGAAVYAVQYYEPTQQHAEQEAQNQGEAKAIDILASERVAYYTKVLAIFTGALTGMGLLQIFFLFRADRTAEKTANAALRSAQAAIGVELPKVFVTSIKLEQRGMGNFEAQIQVPRATVTVKNFGRTPAFLGQQATEGVISAGLPDKPEYRHGHSVPSGTAIEGGHSYELPLASGPFLKIDEIADLVAGKTTFWVFGYVTYRDFLDNWHQLKFCSALYIPTPSEATHGFQPRFLEGGGPEAYEENW